MSSIKTYERTNDLCLLVYDDKYYYIGCIDLPQKNWTVDEYNNWLYKSTVNLIALNDKYIPQQLSHYGLKIEETATDVCNDWKLHYGVCSEDGEQSDFRQLLTSMLGVTDGDFRKAFNSYFEKFYQVF